MHDIYFQTIYLLSHKNQQVCYGTKQKSLGQWFLTKGLQDFWGAHKSAAEGTNLKNKNKKSKHHLGYILLLIFN